MALDAVANDSIVRINQVYRTYLNTVYDIDYTLERHNSLASRSKHIDFLIGIGAAASGGSGLSILASPDFAWLCIPLTTISTVGAIAKGSYDWPGRLQKYIETIQFIAPINHGLKLLTEDIQASKNWKNEFEVAFEKLRNDLAKKPIDMTKDLPLQVRRKIQDAIKHRLIYTTWWGWQDTAVPNADKRN